MRDISPEAQKEVEDAKRRIHQPVYFMQIPAITRYEFWLGAAALCFMTAMVSEIPIKYAGYVFALGVLFVGFFRALAEMFWNGIGRHL